jgi:hypothetical protein
MGAGLGEAVVQEEGSGCSAEGSGPQSRAMSAAQEAGMVVIGPRAVLQPYNLGHQWQ